MTFLPELKRLMDARALGGFGGVDAENELQGYLLNHAPALAELVEAAEKMNKINGPCDHHDHHGYCQTHFVEEGCTAKALSEALAKLNTNDANDGGKHEG